ncbi:MAG: hypothetical protein ACFE89_03265 [Candidatus Hodarchaeota archaeon]
MSEKWIPAKDKRWRDGFLLIWLFTVALFAGNVFFLERGRQAALQLDTLWLTINIANSTPPFLLGNATAVVMIGIIIMFVSTHPNTRQKDIENIILRSFIISLYIGILWYFRIGLAGTLDQSMSPPQYPISVVSIELPTNIIASLAIIIFLTILTLYSWYTWIRPSSWEA